MGSQAYLAMVHVPEMVHLRMNTVSLPQDAACDGGTPAQNEVLSGASSQCSHCGTNILWKKGTTTAHDEGTPARKWVLSGASSQCCK